MKNKKIVIFIALIILLVICVILVVNRSEKCIGHDKNNRVLGINLQQFSLENRAKLLKNNTLFVGNNVKELENGYYDFKLQNAENTVVITLNKLWYEEYGVDYIQDEYLAKICREIAKRLNVNVEKLELEYQLYKYIKGNYVQVKDGNKGEKITMEAISIWSEGVDSECIIYLKVV